MAPFIRAPLGSTHIVDIINRTRFAHPMHLHGQHFRLLAVNGTQAPPSTWLDTVGVAPGATVSIAIPAVNPGRWLFHCHVLEHAMSGMTRVVEFG